MRILSPDHAGKAEPDRRGDKVVASASRLRRCPKSLGFTRAAIVNSAARQGAGDRESFSQNRMDPRIECANRGQIVHGRRFAVSASR